MMFCFLQHRKRARMPHDTDDDDDNDDAESVNADQISLTKVNADIQEIVEYFFPENIGMIFCIKKFKKRFFLTYFFKVGITWTDLKQQELQDMQPFNIEQCKFTLMMPFLETTQDKYFSRELLIEDEKKKSQTFYYFDLGVLTLANRKFQLLPCSMTFGNTFYNLLSGQSKKVIK